MNGVIHVILLKNYDYTMDFFFFTISQGKKKTSESSHVQFFQAKTYFQIRMLRCLSHNPP